MTLQQERVQLQKGGTAVAKLDRTGRQARLLSQLEEWLNTVGVELHVGKWASRLTAVPRLMIYHPPASNDYDLLAQTGAGEEGTLPALLLYREGRQPEIVMPLHAFLSALYDARDSEWGYDPKPSEDFIFDPTTRIKAVRSAVKAAVTEQARRLQQAQSAAEWSGLE